MLKVTKTSTDRLDIELSGALEADAMRSALDDVIEKSEGISQGKMLYVISDFEMPTLGAMAIEFFRMPALLGLISKFDRCAVLSDTGWIRTAAEIEGAVLPSLEIKSFAIKDIAAAEAWLAGDVDDDVESENFPV